MKSKGRKLLSFCCAVAIAVLGLVPHSPGTGVAHAASGARAADACGCVCTAAGCPPIGAPGPPPVGAGGGGSSGGGSSTGSGGGNPGSPGTPPQVYTRLLDGSTVSGVTHLDVVAGPHQANRFKITKVPEVTDIYGTIQVTALVDTSGLPFDLDNSTAYCGPIPTSLSVATLTQGPDYPPNYVTCDVFSNRGAEDTVVFDAGDGNDVVDLRGSSMPATINGGDGDDELRGGTGNDTIDGGSGQDLVDGQEGNDVVNGGSGDDQVFGEGGQNTLDGGDGNDEIWAGAGGDLVYGGSGNDIIHGGIGNDTVWAGAGADTIYGDAGNDFLVGEADNDVIDAGTGDDKLWGYDGDDTMYGGDGNDFMDGSAGNDTLYGGNGTDKIIGNTGNDTLVGDAGDDNVYGSDGNDVLYGSDGNDQLHGENGNDTIYGGNGNDTLWGDADNDQLEGEAGTDIAHGGAGVDTFLMKDGTPSNTLGTADAFDCGDGRDVFMADPVDLFPTGTCEVDDLLSQTHGLKPVVFVHGVDAPFKSTGKPAHDCFADWKAAVSYLQTAHNLQQLPASTVGYYEGDTNCLGTDGAGHVWNANVANYGPSGFGTAARIGANTPIETIAYRFAWYVYDVYSKNGIVVDVVGHSMGGLIARYAMARVQMHDASFPPSLLVDDVVTVETPHGGAFGAAVCAAFFRTSWYECQEMTTGSPFLKWLATNAQNPQPWFNGGTQWTVMGSNFDPIVGGTSALQMSATHFVQFDASNLYGHLILSSPLADKSLTHNASATFYDANGPHMHSAGLPYGLEWIDQALSYDDW